MSPDNAQRFSEFFILLSARLSTRTLCHSNYIGDLAGAITIDGEKAPPPLSGALAFKQQLESHDPFFGVLQGPLFFAAPKLL